VYANFPWDSNLTGDGQYTRECKDQTMLFELHTTCSLKPNERWKSHWQPRVFHISWMEIGRGKVTRGPHQKWNRHNLHGSTDHTIGTVAAFVSRKSLLSYDILTSLMIEYFALFESSIKYPVSNYWTILALLPKSLPTHTSKIGRAARNQNSLWGAIILLITESLEVATRSWVEIAAYMEQLLTSGATSHDDAE
jgi:hypothetical protein